MTRPCRVLGFDFGMRCIGVAVGQTITKTATPLTVLKARDGVPSWDAIQELITQWQIDTIVVGIPLNMDGSEQPLTHLARKFSRKLHGRYHLPVYLEDERLTTFEAKLHKKDQAKSQTTRTDSIAAQLILESWLRKQRME